MKLINKSNFFSTVCEVYALLSIGKIVLEAVTQGKWGNDQMNFILMFVISLGFAIIFY